MKTVIDFFENLVYYGNNIPQINEEYRNNEGTIHVKIKSKTFLHISVLYIKLNSLGQQITKARFVVSKLKWKSFVEKHNIKKGDWY